nr:hypothetical protein [Tanacetum cinerariifolium]
YWSEMFLDSLSEDSSNSVIAGITMSSNG